MDRTLVIQKDDETKFDLVDTLGNTANNLATVLVTFDSREDAEAFEAFLDGYFTCALWSSTDNSDESGGRPLEENYEPDDIEAECFATQVAECLSFFSDNRETWGDDWSDETAGHDFWLTRNRHGAGFWDRGEDQGDKLTEAAHAYGESDIIVTDDGKLYFS